MLTTFLGGHSNHIVGIAFSPDGGLIATASLDGSARIWGGGVTFARTASLLGHSGQVLDVAFTPDGRSVVTASDDGSARVWRPESTRSRHWSVAMRAPAACRVQP